MTTRPSAEIRRQVVERAGNCCEYCLLPQEFAASTHQVDHVIAEKHGGQTTRDNLALSCTAYNCWKGSDIVSIDPAMDGFISLFYLGSSGGQSTSHSRRTHHGPDRRSPHDRILSPPTPSLLNRST